MMWLGRRCAVYSLLDRSHPCQPFFDNKEWRIPFRLGLGDHFHAKNWFSAVFRRFDRREA
jgi:hypothetical protein